MYIQLKTQTIRTSAKFFSTPRSERLFRLENKKSALTDRQSLIFFTRRMSSGYSFQAQFFGERNDFIVVAAFEKFAGVFINAE